MMQTLHAIDDCGLIPSNDGNDNDDNDNNDTTSSNMSAEKVSEHNRQALEKCVTNNNTILSITDEFYLHPGVQWKNVHNFVLAFDNDNNNDSDIRVAALRFVKPPYDLPRDSVDPFANHPVSCLSIADSSNITLTTTTTTTTSRHQHQQRRGLLHGGGPAWWGIPFIGFLQHLERRPKLLQITTSTNIQISNLDFQDAPLYTIYLNGVQRVDIQNCSVVSRRTTSPTHRLLDLSAFNTDGIDVAGHDISIRNVDIWTQDDCIAIKDNYLGKIGDENEGDDSGSGVSRNILIENVNASGLGFVIGSIGGGTVQNVTFRNSLLYRTFKGIYIKFRDYDLIGDGKQNSVVQDILFENITMIEPEQWAIWMGPAQQAGGTSYNPCAAKPCSLCWPNLPGAACNAPEHVSLLSNVTLRDVSIWNPGRSPGILLGNIDRSPLSNIVFEDVRVVESTSANKDFEIIDLQEAFPGLELPVHDPYIRRGLIWLSLCLLAIVVVLTTRGLVYSWRRRRASEFVLVPVVDEDEDNDESERSTTSNGIEGTSSATDVDRAASTEDDERSQPTNGSDAALATNDGMLLQEEVVVSSPLQFRIVVTRRRVILSFLLLAAIIMVIWHLGRHWKLSKVDTYFVCTGVAEGVARGRTWPVPHCFRDETG